MAGVPVLVAGQTHYRGRGFTEDPQSWDDYFRQMDAWLRRPSPARLPPERVELAWRYAYRFFFEYPFPFPWHVVSFWDDLAVHTMAELLSPAGRAAYGPTIHGLLDGSRAAAEFEGAGPKVVSLG